MPSRAEQIAEAVRVLLASPAMVSVPPARIHRDLRGALQETELPAIVVETGDERDPSYTVIGHIDRAVDVTVTVLAAGGYVAADPAHVESHGRIAGSRTLGGLAMDMTEGRISRQREEADRQRVAVSHVYRFEYRTTEGSLQ